MTADRIDIAFVKTHARTLPRGLLHWGRSRYSRLGMLDEATRPGEQCTYATR